MTATMERRAEADAGSKQLWAGDFGDDYVDRNTAFDHREVVLARPAGERWRRRRVLEVGCNVGGNLQWIAGARPPGDVSAST